MRGAKAEFDTFVVVDWSGGNDRGPTPKKDAIWAGLHRGEVAEEPRYFRNRALLEAWFADLVADEIARGRRVLAGFDFPFGYPAGFAAAVTGSPDPLALWDWYAAHLVDTPGGNTRFQLAGRINARFPGTGPFWFNGSREDIRGLPRKGRDVGGHGLPSRRRCEALAPGAFTCWQLGGAGAVGSQAITGMAALARLRAAFPGLLAVWPFEATDRAVVLVEVWPSLYAAEVRAVRRPGEVMDSAQVRFLAGRLAAMQADGTLAPMLDAAPAYARSEEGWIFGVTDPASMS
jgi:molybdopterin molybdotransferase